MTTSPTAGSPLSSVLRLWFGFEAPVGRRSYVVSGLVLMAIKYVGDSWLIHRFGGELWSPLEYLSPFWSQHLLELRSSAAFAWLGAWSLPFIWVGVSMTARRLRNAGIFPLLAILFFLPGINYLLMLTLCFVRPKPHDPRAAHPRGEDPASFAILLRATVAGTVAGGAVLGAAFLLAGEGRYGIGLFVGAPFAVGLVAAFLANREGPLSMRLTQAVVHLAVLALGGILLLFAIEGVLCIAMAYPLAATLAAIGGCVGRAISSPGQLATSHFLVVVALAPLMTALDRAAPEPPLREIVTAIEVDAPPSDVWPHVVAFSELPPPNELTFRLGIAYPKRARIVGHGVGAVRYCEFSTGPFVEPITRWEEPHRLSFDVAAQPPTMHEWSPYDIAPKHLTESLHSERGEFRLVPLPGGRTRLEGSTWYRQSLFPQTYWSLWSDNLIHRIHHRVLRHIASRSVSDPATGVQP